MTTSNLPSSEPNRGVFENWRLVTILLQFIVGSASGNHYVKNTAMRYLDITNLFLVCILPGNCISPLVVFSGMLNGLYSVGGQMGDGGNLDLIMICFICSRQFYPYNL